MIFVKNVVNLGWSTLDSQEDNFNGRSASCSLMLFAVWPSGNFLGLFYVRSEEDSWGQHRTFSPKKEIDRPKVRIVMEKRRGKRTRNGCVIDRAKTVNSCPLMLFLSPTTQLYCEWLDQRMGWLNWYSSGCAKSSELYNESTYKLRWWSRIDATSQPTTIILRGEYKMWKN